MSNINIFSSEPTTFSGSLSIPSGTSQTLSSESFFIGKKLTHSYIFFVENSSSSDAVARVCVSNLKDFSVWTCIYTEKIDPKSSKSFYFNDVFNFEYTKIEFTSSSGELIFNSVHNPIYKPKSSGNFPVNFYTPTETFSGTPTLTPSTPPTTTVTETATITPTTTVTETATITPTTTVTETATITPTATVTETATITPTTTVTETATITPTATDTVTETTTITQTITHTSTFDECCGEVKNLIEIVNTSDIVESDRRTGEEILIQNISNLMQDSSVCIGGVSKSVDLKTVNIKVGNTDPAKEFSLATVKFEGNLDDQTIFIKKRYGDVNSGTDPADQFFSTDSTPTETINPCGYGFCVEYTPCQEGDIDPSRCIDRLVCSGALDIGNVHIAFRPGQIPPEVFVDVGRCYRKVGGSQAKNCSFFIDDNTGCGGTGDKFLNETQFNKNFVKKLNDTVVIADDCNQCCACSQDTTCFSCDIQWSGNSGDCDVSNP